MINPNCPICGDLGWVCENHPQLAWTRDPRGCQCGAGMRCAYNGSDDIGPSVEWPNVSVTLEKPPPARN